MDAHTPSPILPSPFPPLIPSGSRGPVRSYFPRSGNTHLSLGSQGVGSIGTMEDPRNCSRA